MMNLVDTSGVDLKGILTQEAELGDRFRKKDVPRQSAEHLFSKFN